METKKHVPNEEQEKTLEKELNKMEAIDLPDAKLKTLVVRMFKELRGKIDELSENIHKKIGNIKKNKSEITNTMN